MNNIKEGYERTGAQTSLYWRISFENGLHAVYTHNCYAGDEEESKKTFSGNFEQCSEFVHQLKKRCLAEYLETQY